MASVNVAVEATSEPASLRRREKPFRGKRECRRWMRQILFFNKVVNCIKRNTPHQSADADSFPPRGSLTRNREQVFVCEEALRSLLLGEKGDHRRWWMRGELRHNHYLKKNRMRNSRLSWAQQGRLQQASMLPPRCAAFAMLNATVDIDISPHRAAETRKSISKFKNN